MPLMNGLQPMHLILIVAIIVIVFGPSKLPELGQSLGKGIREFKRSTEEITDIKESVTSSVSSAMSLESKPATPATAAPLPSKPEPRHEPVTLARQEID
jgi:sec-independent protein translocase protein TatA